MGLKRRYILQSIAGAIGELTIQETISPNILNAIEHYVDRLFKM